MSELKEKLENQRKTNEILKLELERQKKNYDDQIDILNSNFSIKMKKQKNEFDFQIKSIEYEYNKLKEELNTINKPIKLNDYFYYFFN